MRHSAWWVRGHAVVLAAAFMLIADGASMAQSGRRSGAGPCRQGALSVIAALDAKEDNTPAYRNAFSGIVETCGPVAHTTPAPGDRATCGDLALKLLDTIEDGKISMRDFAMTRDAFAQTCTPR